MSPRLKKSQSVKISLISPNEAKALVEKERHRRRLLRLQQMREQDKARSQLNGQLIKDMKDQLMKAVAENIAETVRQAYRIEVVPVASTLNGVIQQTPHLRSRQNGASINDESRKRLSATVTTPLKRLQRTSNVISRTPVIRKLPYCAHKHRRCSACNPNFK